MVQNQKNINERKQWVYFGDGYIFLKFVAETIGPWGLGTAARELVEETVTPRQSYGRPKSWLVSAKENILGIFGRQPLDSFKCSYLFIVLDRLF